jgi:hypothetical protein
MSHTESGACRTLNPDDVAQFEWGRKSAGKSISWGILPANHKEAGMSQERLTVRKIREVLRLKHEVGLSHRAIARACRVSNSTVGEYVKRAEQAELVWPLPEVSVSVVKVLKSSK